MVKSISKVVRNGSNRILERTEEPKVTVEPVVKATKNKKTKKSETMTEEEMRVLSETAEGLDRVKRLKSDRGLIERTESSKIILAEDNRQVLVD